MHFLNRVFRPAALSLATILFAAGPAVAASTSTPSHHWRLMSTNAKLNQSLNSSHVKVGQRVTAHLTMALHAPSGITLPRKTKLIGKISQVQRGQNKPTSISLVFTEARLKNGHTIPIKATLLGVKPPAYGYGVQKYFPHSSKRVASDAQIDQEPGALRHIAMHSSVLSHNSGTLQRKHGNIDLRAGTQFRLAIATRQNTKEG